MNNTSMNDNAKRAATYATTAPEVRLIYPHLFEKYAYDPADIAKAKYQTCILIRKDDAQTLNSLNAAIQAAYELGKDKIGYLRTVTVPGGEGNPLHDGDLKAAKDNKPFYAGCWYLNAKTAAAPVICDARKHPITDENRVYGGVFARARVHFFAFRNLASGIACSLDGVQIVRDGEPLPKPADDVLNCFTVMGVAKRPSGVELAAGGSQDPRGTEPAGEISGYKEYDDSFLY